MKRKGFTLIELLAVIVVLAIIALIATPIVMNTIEKSKKGAAERTADSYVRAIETYIATFYVENGFSEDATGTLPVEALNEEIEVKGDKPTSGWVEVEQGVVIDYELEIGDYTVIYDKDKKTGVATKIITYDIELNLTNVINDDSNVNKITNLETKTLTFAANAGYSLPESVKVSGATYTWNKETGTLVLSKVTGNVTVTIVGEEIKVTKTYTNGEIVYFNVTTGEKCSSSDYTETQSNIGINSGCMKFYAFNDDGGDTVNLILDHNTTAGVEWVSKEDYVVAGGTESDYGANGKNDKGPLTLLAQLKTDTSSWVGTITPANYTMDQSTQESQANYTIDYSSYKARLITAQEIAQITGNISWDEKNAGTDDWYYLDSKTTTESYRCRYADISECKYRWLYDRTHINCITKGCLNNSDQETYGYWTASSRADSSIFVWYISFDSRFNSANLRSDSGVRPVIEVLKTNLN